MKRLLLSLFLVLVLPAQVHAETSVSFGGTILNSNSISTNGSLEYSHETGPRQGVYEIDYLYQKESGEEIEKRIAMSGKSILAFDNKNYAFVLGRYEYDEFNAYKQRLLTGLGWGYKLFRTSTTKMSNEFSVGTLTNDEGTSPVFRNSIWLRQRLSENTTFVNKFLVEQGKNTFLLNKTSLVYSLAPAVDASINHIYKRDKFAVVMNNNLTTFEVAYRFQ